MDFDKPLAATSVAADLQDQAALASLSPPDLTASTDDRLSQYQEGRSDVRVYATLLIQVITVLLSTMIVVMGWIAKDYATEKYHVALQAVAPSIANPPAAVSAPGAGLQASLPPPHADQILTGIEQQLDYVSVVYLHLLYNSPTTSLLLFGAAFFTL